MKKTTKSIVAMVISIVFIATLPVSAFAYEFGTVDINAMVQKEYVGKKILTSISSSWSGTGPSASIGVTFSTIYDKYTLYYPWNFKADYDKFFK